ncbi:hypothetical protein Taro_053991, partial [Colocasia esculenta]|nr:hypothetical protein [Colocasia esculenta]
MNSICKYIYNYSSLIIPHFFYRFTLCYRAPPSP